MVGSQDLGSFDKIYTRSIHRIYTRSNHRIGDLSTDLNKIYSQDWGSFDRINTRFIHRILDLLTVIQGLYRVYFRMLIDTLKVHT